MYHLTMFGSVTLLPVLARPYRSVREIVQLCYLSTIEITSVGDLYAEIHDDVP